MKIKTTVTQILIITFLFSGVTLAVEEIKNGIKAYDNDDYELAFSILSKTKTDNNLKAKFYLGVMYYQGLGNDGNTLLGIDLIKAAAKGGHTEAKIYLVVEYNSGSIKSISDEKAFKYLKESADENHIDAIYIMGWVHYNGNKYITQNFEKAYELFKKSAYMGNLNSAYPLAFMSYEGTGIPKNHREAYTWALIGSGVYNRDAIEFLNMLEEKLSEDDKTVATKKAEAILTSISSKKSSK